MNNTRDTNPGRVAVEVLELPVLPIQRDPATDGGRRPRAFEIGVVTTGQVDVSADGRAISVEVRLPSGSLYWAPASALTREGEPYVPKLLPRTKTMPMGVRVVCSCEVRDNDDGSVTDWRDPACAVHGDQVTT